MTRNEENYMGQKMEHDMEIGMQHCGGVGDLMQLVW